LDGGCWQLF